MITIQPSKTADTRTCDVTKVTRKQLLDSSVQHIGDVGKALAFFGLLTQARLLGGIRRARAPKRSMSSTRVAMPTARALVSIAHRVTAAHRGARCAMSKAQNQQKGR